MLVEDQTEIFQFLERLLGEHSAVETISTHASRIFLTNTKAYKMKRAVRFNYLDYGTPQQRHAACLSEFALNRRTAPTLYLDVHTITREEDGQLALDGSGTLLDAVIEMHRFPADCLFDHMAQNGSLTSTLISNLAKRIADFHREAPLSINHGGTKGIARVLDINDHALRATGLVSEEIASAFRDQFQQRLATHSEMLEARHRSGKVRRCHSDLILRNICLLDGTPTLFDCIEFDEDIATIDVLYDLAFLLMDLWRRDQRALANMLFNRYLDAADEIDGIGLVPFFMAIRAAVRCHVGAAQAQNSPADLAEKARSEAFQYFELTRQMLEPRPAVLVAIGGLSGTGRSTVAAALAAYLGSAPGARVLNSDRIRKPIFGVPVETRLPPEAYAPDVSDRVYATLRQETGRVLDAGCPVVVDAVFDRPDEREAVRRLAAAHGVSFAGYWLSAPTDLLVTRVTARRYDPSDATAEIVRKQAAREQGEIDWISLDASRTPAAVSDDILAR